MSHSDALTLRYVSNKENRDLFRRGSHELPHQRFTSRQEDHLKACVEMHILGLSTE